MNMLKSILIISAVVIVQITAWDVGTNLARNTPAIRKR